MKGSKVSTPTAAISNSGPVSTGGSVAENGRFIGWLRTRDADFHANSSAVELTMRLVGSPSRFASDAPWYAAPVRSAMDRALGGDHGVLAIEGHRMKIEVKRFSGQQILTVELPVPNGQEPK